MSTILITGASGLLGKALATSLSPRHRVLCLSRKAPGLKLPYFQGDFAKPEDLKQLDKEPIDTLLHLGAVTGGCSEHDGIMVNVAGTRTIMRYLIDRGVKKFVLASSSAAVGYQAIKFRPLQVPMPDEHPCLDTHGYGLSKYLMEEVLRYLQRQNPQIDTIALRLAYVPPADRMPPLRKVSPIGEWALGGITVMHIEDAIDVFTRALESPLKPGLRIMNAVSRQAWVADPTAKVLRHWWGNDVDLSHFEKPGHEFDGLYDVSLIQRELGFVARHLPVR